MKRYAWILIIVGILAIVGTAFQLAPHRVPERTCPSRIVMTKGKDDKADRLAAALRENLRRRKAQAREVQPNKDPTQAAKE